MEEAVILDGIRTPFGNFGGTLKDLSAVDLGVLVLRRFWKRREFLRTESGNQFLET